MTKRMETGRITGRAVLERQLDALVAADPDLRPLREMAGEVPLRLNRPGFAGMAQIVNSQLLSVASARAIHGRFEAALGEVTARRFLAFGESEIRACGLSGAKYRTLKALAEAERDGRLDYGALGQMEAEAALAALTGLNGIGPWSAEIYLLFCTGHPDIFPAGDLALRKMVGYAQGRDAMPSIAETRAAAERWAPWRGAAARLLWRCFAVMKRKEGIGL